LERKEIPVFDRRDSVDKIIDKKGEWTPSRRPAVRGAAVKLDSDGPDITWRVSAQAARITSNAYSGQADNDNLDWPLQKLLRTECNAECLALAERYRDLYDTAHQPTQLIGKDADNLFMVENTDEEGKSKGAKVVRGKKAQVDTLPVRNLAGPVPKKWNGDWPLLAAIDAKRELAILRAKLGYVPKILDAFEWAVCDGPTLEQIGKRLGAGSKGAKGEARARIFDGFGIVDRHWRAQRRRAA
jgi:hypothetical protein